MSTQAEIQAAQKAEYDALVARVDALEASVSELDARVTALEEAAPPADDSGDEPMATSKSKRHA